MGRSLQRRLNSPPPTITAEAHDPDTDQDVSTAPLEKEEIMAAMKSLKNGKPWDRICQPQRRTPQGKARVCSTIVQRLFAAISEDKSYLTTGRRVSS